MQVLHTLISGTGDTWCCKRLLQQTAFRYAQLRFKTRCTVLYKSLIPTSQRKLCTFVRNTNILMPHKKIILRVIRYMCRVHKYIIDIYWCLGLPTV